VRFLPNDNELYLTHDTWSEFNQMLRILKDYQFHFTGVANTRIKFTSYPATLWSGDDLYVFGDLVVTETTGEVYDVMLWNMLTFKSVLTFARTMIANRLATSAVNWAAVAKQYNSGTYNNMWIVVDYSLFRARKQVDVLPAGTVYVLETLPGLTQETDLSALITKQGWFGSFNVWYSSVIYDTSGTALVVATFGDWFSFDGASRSRIFQRDAPKTRTMADIKTLVRSNAYLTDPLAVEPTRSAFNAISSRGDLFLPNITQPFYLLPFCLGGIDAKITNSAMMQKLNFLVVGGPTYGGVDKLAPFNWKDWDVNAPTTSSRPCDGVPHNGQAELQQFDWFTY